eukprot:g6990.t1
MDALAIHAVKYSSPASFKMKAGSNREKKESDSESKDDRDPFSPPLLRAGKNAEQQQTFLRVAKEEMERRSRGGGVPYQTPKMEPRVRFASENFELSPNRNRLMRRQVSTELGSNSALEALSLDSGTIAKSKSTINFMDLKIDEHMTNAYKARAIKSTPRPANVSMARPATPGSPAEKALGAAPAKPTIPLGEIVVPLVDGIESIVDDGFQKCFERRSEPSWNWNLYLFVPWCAGVVLRNFVFFPIRLVIWIVGHVLFFTAFALGSVYYSLTGNAVARKRFEVGLVKFLASAYVVSWSGVVKFHGIRPQMKRCVFVANHSTMIDTAILLQHNVYSLVGQMHSSAYVSFIQRVALRSMNCIWFNRGENRDRAKVSDRLRKHAQNEHGDLQPLLIFPEGTCVNNDYVVQFKKTVFDLDENIAICPIAIKYNKSFVDAYWISSKEGFLMYLFRLMRSFCLVCDVWYMDSMYRRKDETAIQFAGRVQQAIADQAGLKNTQYDGYMKYWTPSLRYKRARQLAFAHAVVPPSMLKKAK